MNAAVSGRLLQINQKFYAEHGHDFSKTRQRLQPGVRRVMETLRGDESILDLGCGNGELARALGARDHRGAYVGVDFSGPLLDVARIRNGKLVAHFVQGDLVEWSAKKSPAGKLPPFDLLPAASGWDLVTAFALLHHIPGRALRLRLLRAARAWIRPGGRFVLSNWQFLGNPRSQSHLVPWKAAGLSPVELDPGDHLLDWRHGSIGLRYVHQFDEAELLDLATASDFVVAETFYADGADRRSGLYEVWSPA